MTLFTTLFIAVFASLPHAAGGQLERISKEIWQDHFYYTCFKQKPTKAFKVNKLWKYSLRSERFRAPLTLTADGSIVAVDTRGTIHFLSQKGKALFTTEPLGHGNDAPQVLSDGNLIYSNTNHKLFFISPRGEVLNRHDLAAEKIRLKGVAIFGDTAVVATRGKSVYVYNSNGTLRTHLKLPSELSAPPIITSKQVIAVGTEDLAINFFSLSGEPLGRAFLKPYRAADELTPGPNGDIIVKSFAKNIHYIDSSLKIREEFEIVHSSDREHGVLFLPNDRMVFSLAPFENAVLFVKNNGDYSWQVNFGYKQRPMHTPILSPTGEVVVALKGGDLKFLSTDGHTTGSYTLGQVSASIRTPVVLSDGTAVIDWEGGAIHWVTPDGSLRAKFNTGRPHLSAQLLALPDDRVVVATSDGEVLMLKASSKQMTRFNAWERVDCPLHTR